MSGILIGIALLAYARAIVAFKQGATYINSNILGMIVNFLATLIPIGLYLLMSSQRYSPSGSHAKGYAWAIGGAVFLASLVGVLLYKEKISIPQIAGLVCIVAGIVLVSVATFREERG